MPDNGTKRSKSIARHFGSPPTIPSLCADSALLSYDQGQLLKAFPLLKQAAETKPDDIEVQIRLALAYLSARELGLAREIALSILGKQPGHERALLLVADTATSADEIAETRKLVEGYRAKDQDRPSYHVALGALDLRQKDDAGAETEFKRALELDPKSATGYSRPRKSLLVARRSQGRRRSL